MSESCVCICVYVCCSASMSTPSFVSPKKSKKSLTSRLMKGFNSYVSGRATSSESSSAPVTPSVSSMQISLTRDRGRDEDADVDVDGHGDRGEDEATIAMRNNIAGDDNADLTFKNPTEMVQHFILLLPFSENSY